jgi:hypothetical protein
VGGQPAQERVSPAVVERVGDRGRDPGQVLVAGVVGGGVQAQQRGQRLLGPDLVGVGLGRGGQLPGQVRPAQSVVGIGVGVVERQCVVHRDAAVAGQHPELVDRGPAAGAVQVIGGEPVGASDVQPPAGAGDADRGLVDVHHVRQHEQRSDQPLDLDERGGRLAQRGADPAGGRPRPGQVGN